MAFKKRKILFKIFGEVKNSQKFYGVNPQLIWQSQDKKKK